MVGARGQGTLEAISGQVKAKPQADEALIRPNNALGLLRRSFPLAPAPGPWSQFIHNVNNRHLKPSAVMRS